MSTVRLKKIFPLILVLLIVIGLVFLFNNKDMDVKVSPVNESQGSCISCHGEMKGFTPQHQDLNCVSCHLGDGALANIKDKESAHQGLVSIPGNLSNASKTCSSSGCHVGIDQRIEHSMMNTISGIINVDKYVFGEHQNLDSIFNVHHLGFSMADKHLRNKCASCHIGNEKTDYAPISELSRGGGCLACHLNYTTEAKNQLGEFMELGEMPKVHPQISLQVTDDHCFGCHSRSGRIATNYEGWHETNLTDYAGLDRQQYRLLDDKRIFIKKTPDLHHELGLSCIDCHDTWDVMGDGQSYAHKEDAVQSACVDCHGDSNPVTMTYDQLDDASQRMVNNRGMDKLNNYLVVSKSERVLTNVVVKDGKRFMIGKNNGKAYLLSALADPCTNESHSMVSCSTCHTSWAPQCISCHTNFESEKKGYDLLAKKLVDGTWVEKGDHYLTGYPSLGVISNSSGDEIKTFTPGMVLSLVSETDDFESFFRLFAPTSAHTIAAKGRDCKSCHNDPVALGYGRGELVYGRSGMWTFTASFEDHQDGLPLDAWIGFLSDDTAHRSTRSNARPFSFEEQKTMLSVGACLTCHEDNSKVTGDMLKDFQLVLSKVSSRCVLPNINQQIDDYSN